MSDWIKAVLTLITGIAVGVILEPIKHWLQTYFGARRAKKAIYKELGDIYYSYVLLNDSAPEYYSILLTNFVPSAFQYYYDTHRESFYRLDEWQYLLGLYNSLQGLKQQALKGHGRNEIHGAIKGEFEFRFKGGLIEEDTVLKYAEEMKAERRTALKRAQ